MKQHKWHKEIKAWADGETVQIKLINMNEWIDVDEWHLKRFGNDNYEFRIKPQTKEPQYLYVYKQWKSGMIDFSLENENNSSNVLDGQFNYVGKIKLEVEDGN